MHKEWYEKKFLWHSEVFWVFWFLGVFIDLIIVSAFDLILWCPSTIHCTLILLGLNTFVLQGNPKQYNGKSCIICKVVVYLELECLIILLCLLEELFQGAWWHVLSDEYHLVEKPKTETSSKQHKIFYLASCSQLCFRSFVQLRHFESSYFLFLQQLIITIWRFESLEILMFIVLISYGPPYLKSFFLLCRKQLFLIMQTK